MNPISTPGPKGKPSCCAAYSKARLLAAEETGLEEARFPPQPPFTAAQALAADYWPS
ncbi:DUF29 family protein [Methylothermus subterraneus]